VKVRDVFKNWPPLKWAADDPAHGALKSDPGDLRLLWFSAPDDDGWFSLTGTDAEGVSWSTYYRTSAAVWRPLEHALKESLREPLQRVGDVELATNTVPLSRPR
jgi:hypothetical protein